MRFAKKRELEQFLNEKVKENRGGWAKIVSFFRLASDPEQPIVVRVKNAEMLVRNLAKRGIELDKSCIIELLGGGEE